MCTDKFDSRFSYLQLIGCFVFQEIFVYSIALAENFKTSLSIATKRSVQLHKDLPTFAAYTKHTNIQLADTIFIILLLLNRTPDRRIVRIRCAILLCRRCCCCWLFSVLLSRIKIRQTICVDVSRGTWILAASHLPLCGSHNFTLVLRVFHLNVDTATVICHQLIKIYQPISLRIHTVQIALGLNFFSRTNADNRPNVTIYSIHICAFWYEMRVIWYLSHFQN